MPSRLVRLAFPSLTSSTSETSPPDGHRARADIFVSLLEIASTAAGYIEGTLSQECVGLFSLLALLNPSPLNDSMFPYLYRTAISVAGMLPLDTCSRHLETDD